MCATTVKSIIGICVSLFLVMCIYVNRTARNPYYGKAFQRLAWECQNGCDSNKRFRYLQKAVYYDPNLSDVYYQLGTIYNRQGNYEKAIELYKKVVALDYTNADAYFKVGLYYFQKGELDYALRYFLQSDRHKQSSHDTIYYMATIYDKNKMYKDAVFHYIRLVSWGSPYSAELCDRIWRISKIPDQYKMVLDKVYQLHHNGQRELFEQVDQYIRTDQVPEFMRKPMETGARNGVRLN